MGSRSLRVRDWGRILGLNPPLTEEEQTRLRSVADEANLDDDETFILAVSLYHDRVRLSSELIHEARAAFRRNPRVRSRIGVRLGHLSEGDRGQNDFLIQVEHNLNEFCRRYLGEAVFRDEWAGELGGKTSLRLRSGVADIVTRARVYEVKDISKWKQGLGQAIIYANEVGLEPGLALFGPELQADAMEAVRQIASGMGVDLLLKVWKHENGKHGGPSEQLRSRELSLAPDLPERIRELELKKKRIGDEMDRLVRAFSLSGTGSKAAGCLRLEDVYNVKNNRRYGPYGPYYYIYLHRTGKLEKRYLGKNAEEFKVRRDAITKLRQLEAEYKRVLKLERRLLREAL